MPKLPPPPPKPEEEEDLRSRTDARTERKRAEDVLLDLARRLVELNDRGLQRLTLPDDVLAIVRQARAVPRSSAAGNRALRLVRIALRGVDTVQLRKRLDGQHDPRRAQAPSTPSAASLWRDRLVEGGDATLDAFVDAAPDADRHRVRQLVRNVKRATDATRAERERALREAVEDALRSKP